MKIETRRFQSYSVLTLSAFPLLACNGLPLWHANLKNSQAPRAPVDVVSDAQEQIRLGLPGVGDGVKVQTFAKRDYLLRRNGNLIFFWKRIDGKVLSDDVKEVLLASRALERVEDETYRQQRRFLELKAPFVQEGIDPDDTEAREKDLTSPETENQRQQLARTRTDLEVEKAKPENKQIEEQLLALQAELSAEEAKPREQQDWSKIAELNRRIAEEKARPAYVAYQKKLKQLSGRVDRLQKALDEKERAAEEAHRAIAAAKLEKEWVDYKAEGARIRAELGVLSEEAGRVIATIGSRVEPIKGTPELELRFREDGSIFARLSGWEPPVGWLGGENPAEGERRQPAIFSTENGLIRNVSYVELGGTFRFSLVLQGARYDFRISRTRYRAPDAVPRFKGEVVLDRGDGSPPLRGVVVLAETGGA